MKATSVASVGIVPEVLTVDNYERWSAIMKKYLMGQGLWDVVISGDNTDHLNNTPDIEQGHGDAYRRKKVSEDERRVSMKMINAKALHIIQLSCGGQIQDELFDFELARDAWDYLSTRYGKILKIKVDKVQQVNGLRMHHKELLMKVERGDSIENMEIDRGVYDDDITSDHSGRTLLHIAVNAGNVKNVEKLVSEGNDKFVKRQDMLGNTALALAACYNVKLDIVKCLVDSQYGKILLMEPNTKGEIPVLLSAANGHKEMTSYLYSKTPKEALDKEYSQNRVLATSKLNRVLLLERCIAAKMFGGLPKFLVQITKSLNIFGTREMYDIKYTHYEVLGILKHFSQNIEGFNDSQLRQASAHEAMLYAAKNGTIEFINAMREANPDLLSVTDNSDRGIIWHAILNRRRNVFQLLYFLNGLEKEMFTYGTDAFGNNLLHMTALFDPSSNGDGRFSSPAMQLQREIQWFKAVEEVVHPKCKEDKNKDGKKPSKVFTESHEELLKAGEKWIKDKASSYIAVAFLVLTAMFAAGFTVPGGNNQETGGKSANLQYENMFVEFLTLDVASIFTAATSAFAFMVILTSHYTEKLFLRVLPMMLLAGHLSLTTSISAMMGAFYCALNMILEEHRTRSGVFLLVLVLFITCAPIILLLIYQMHFVKDYFYSTVKNPISLYNTHQTRYFKKSIM